MKLNTNVKERVDKMRYINLNLSALRLSVWFFGYCYLYYQLESINVHNGFQTLSTKNMPIEYPSKHRKYKETRA